MEGKRSFDQYQMPEELWQKMKSLLPNYPVHPSGGRPRADLRRVANAIFYRFRTGCQWKAIPPELASGSTAHQYFQEWVRLGVFAKLWAVAIEYYDDLIGLDWQWQSVDGAMTKAPLGGEKTGKNPTDRGKLGVKRSVLTEGRGVPLGVVVEGANVHDIRLLQATIEDCLERLGRDRPPKESHLCLDQGYNSAPIRLLVEAVYGYEVHIQSGEKAANKNPPGARPRRWVVERTHSWLNRFRGILVRWEKKAANHIAGLHLACAYFTLRLAGVFG
ncbi:MAG TPA: IS5 family transposase [Thermoguttaceae bacterium]|nr:IS5 family transposase [Thermoguttaceae bacterium]